MMGQFLDVVHQAIQLHWPSTLRRASRVKRSSRLLPRRLPNTGSTVAKRAVIIRRPKALSILTFTRSVWLSCPSRLPQRAHEYWIDVQNCLVLVVGKIGPCGTPVSLSLHLFVRHLIIKRPGKRRSDGPVGKLAAADDRGGTADDGRGHATSNPREELGGQLDLIDQRACPLGSLPTAYRSGRCHPGCGRWYLRSERAQERSLDEA